jgi:hypothetical protein
MICLLLGHRWERLILEGDESSSERGSFAVLSLGESRLRGENEVLETEPVRRTKRSGDEVLNFHGPLVLRIITLKSMRRGRHARYVSSVYLLQWSISLTLCSARRVQACGR